MTDHPPSPASASVRALDAPSVAAFDLLWSLLVLLVVLLLIVDMPAMGVT